MFTRAIYIMLCSLAMRNFKGTATAVFVVPQVNIDVFEDARLSNIDIRQDVASNSLHNTLVHTEYEQLRN